MRPTLRHAVLLCAVALLAIGALCACGPQTPEPTPTPADTPTPEATATPAPTATETPTPFPTPNEPAPSRTFTNVGNVADFSGAHNVSGRATVAGLQTLIIQRFNFDGKGPTADIRLVKGQDFANPIVVLKTLEQREYVNEMVFLQVPASTPPDSADTIAIYCAETSEVYASAVFH